MPSQEASYPKTIAEAVDRLLSTLSEKDREAIKNMPKNDLIDLHFSLGGYIKNAFGLWKDNKELIEACGQSYPIFVPDSVSEVIIEALWEKLRGKYDDLDISSESEKISGRLLLENVQSYYVGNKAEPFPQ